MAAVRGILVKQFGGPEVLEYVETLSRPSEPVGKQVFFILIIHPVILLKLLQIVDNNSDRCDAIMVFSIEQNAVKIQVVTISRVKVNIVSWTMFMFISNAVFLNLSFYHEIQSCDLEIKVSGLESTGRQFLKVLVLMLRLDMRSWFGVET